MEAVDKDMQLNAKLRIAFPKSSEDNRLQLIEINGAIFAIVYAPLESLGPIRLGCEEWSLILLAPIKSKTNIVVSAINVICLNEIASEEGSVNIHASNRLVKLANLVSAGETICEMGEQGEFALTDNPGAILHYYRLFDGIVGSIREGTPNAISDAQQKCIMSLCTLADKIQGSPENLHLQKVLGVWKIPYLETI